jgi:hypothetical protein
MSKPTKAVLLSYASQDAEAVRRICEMLTRGREIGVIVISYSLTVAPNIDVDRDCGEVIA